MQLRGLAGTLLLSLMTLGAGSAQAQFVSHATMRPADQAALQIAPDRRPPTIEEQARIEALEAEVRIDQPCNTTWQKELEAPRRELLALYEATYGPDHPATARPILSLLCHLFYNARGDPEYGRLADRLVAIGAARSQPLIAYAGYSARLTRAANLGNLARSLDDAQAKADLAARLFGSASRELADAKGDIGTALVAQDRPVDADQYMLDQIAIYESLTGIDPLTLAGLYEAYGDHLGREMRAADSASWYAKAITIYETAATAADSNGLVEIVARAQRIYWHDPPRVEALYRSILARQEAAPGSNDARNWMTLWSLSRVLALTGQREEAAELLRRVIVAVGPGPDNSHLLELADMAAGIAEAEPAVQLILRAALADDPDNPALLEKLGGSLMRGGKLAEGIAVSAHGVSTAVARYGPNNRETLRLSLNFARYLKWMSTKGEARPYYRQTLDGYLAELAAMPETAAADYRQTLRGWIGTVATELLKLYWDDRTNPQEGGDAAALRAAFPVAQYANPTTSAAAISERAARALATSQGQGALYQSWVDARAELAALDAALGASAQDAANGAATRAGLVAARPAVVARLDQATARLRRDLPRLFAVLRPQPVALDELQQTLLRPDEVLLLLYPGMTEYTGEQSRGVVFAVTREGSAWAEIGRDGADLYDDIAKLRDPLSEPEVLATPADLASDSAEKAIRFDRAAAHRLYRTLFGDPAVARLAEGKDRWVLVPQGPLLSLPFAALVTRPPAGGARGDIEPDQLRATGWLGLERALTVLPSVDALRVARAGSAARAGPGAGFFGLGDPAFSGTPDPPLPPDPAPRSVTRDAAQPAMASFYRGDTANLQSLAALPRLTASAAEVAAIARSMPAGSSTVRLQMDASQARLAADSTAGALHRSGLILFATHTLLGGEPGSGAEPALALTPKLPAAGSPPDPADDGLLTASEAATLDLGSGLVVLSACDTAAGNKGGEGFSGLVRAFITAGARAVVATHFPLFDKAGERLTTGMVAGLGTAHGDVAQAMNGAMRALAADTSRDQSGLSYAHPANWAPFVVVDPN